MSPCSVQQSVAIRFARRTRQRAPVCFIRRPITTTLIRLGTKLDLQGLKVAAPHVTVTSFATDSVASPGTHFSVVVDVIPDRRVHVYAPGAVGYRPVALTIDPQPGLVVRAARFPEASDYFFKPLNEHVPVFDRPFRLLQDLEIDPSPAVAPALKEKPTMRITRPAASRTGKARSRIQRTALLPG